MKQKPKTNMKIILDNGHGNDTEGKRSPSWSSGTPQIFEWSYNRRITAAIHKALPDNTIILVPEDNDIPLKERVERANAISKQYSNNVLLLSIHLNAHTTATPKGWEIHTVKGATPSDKFADIFYKSAQNILLTEGITMRSKFKSDFYILKQTICPAVLTENLFMTNENDCIYLNSTIGFNNIVKLHIDAINQILNVK